MARHNSGSFMKSNINLPKIDSHVKSSSYILSDKNDPIFPRGEHPDTRSNKEWLILMGFEKSRRSTAKWFHKEKRTNRRPVLCINTGERYDGITIAEKDLGLHKGDISAHIRGERDSVRGYRFKFI